MNIVTGYTGTPHITANEAQALNQGILGSGNYVLDVGQRFSATIVDANNITIEDGEGVLQGVQFRIAPGETENVSISNGTTGYNRIDLICARYTKDPQTGIEAVNLVVIEGEPSSSTPTEPDYNTGDVLSNDSPIDFPLYKVTLTGLTPAITQVFPNRMITKKIYPYTTVQGVQEAPGYYVMTLSDPVTLPAGTYAINLYSEFQDNVTLFESIEMKFVINGETLAREWRPADVRTLSMRATDFVHLDAEATGTIYIIADKLTDTVPSARFGYNFKALRV